MELHSFAWMEASIGRHIKKGSDAFWSGKMEKDIEI